MTGGAGYIGSITAAALEEHGHTPVILDSLLTGPQAFTRNRIFYEGDIADRQSNQRDCFASTPTLSALYIWRPELSCRSQWLFRTNITGTMLPSL